MAKKNTAALMTVTVFATQPVYVEGRLMDENESALTLRVKKPRSSKYYLKQIVKKQIICMTQAEEDEGTFVWATLRSQRDVLDSMTGTVEIEDGFITVTDEDGKVLMVAADCAEIEGDDTEAEAEGKKASKKPAAKKASKKDDDEEDEDDEEEEKPRKSSKPAKGKAKKVVDDDDDDDDEEDDEEDEKPRKSSKGKGGKSKKVEEEDEGWDD